MSIKVTWGKAQHVSSFLNYRVYRGTTAENTYASTPLTEITSIDTVTYTDATAATDQLYYYGVGIVTASGMFKSTPRPLCQVLYPGEGGTEVLRGDTTFGFIGEASSALFAVATSAVEERLRELGPDYITRTNPTLMANGRIVLNKYIRNGRYLYVPTIYSLWNGSAIGSVKDVYEKYVVPLANNPIYITVTGTKYKIVPLSMDEIRDIHLASSMADTGRSKRFIKVQTVGTYSTNAAGAIGTPDSLNRVCAYAGNPTSPVTYYAATSTQSIPGYPIAWGLEPVSP